MTTEEQQQVNAAMAYMERQCGNLASAGAQKAIECEIYAQQLKAAHAEIERLKAFEPKPETKLEVVP